MIEHWRVIARAGFMVDAGVIHPDVARRLVAAAAPQRPGRQSGYQGRPTSQRVRSSRLTDRG
jgi:hypothetical protein